MASGPFGAGSALLAGPLGPPAPPGSRRRRRPLALILSACLALPLAAQKRVALTFDDLPFAPPSVALAAQRALTAKLLGALRRHRAPAIGFVNEDKLFVKGEVDGRIGLLEAWLDAGFELGNHTWGHVGFQATPLAAYEDAVVRGDAVTRGLLAKRGKVPRYYRHPFTQTGPTKEDKAAFEAFLAARGYAVAPFTVEHDDFVFAAVYEDAVKQGRRKEAAKVLEAYVAHLDPALETFESMAAELFGREVPQILLVHASRLNADAMEAMLVKLERRGYAFVSLEEALKDPAYASPDGYVGPRGPSWLLRWSKGLGRSTTRKGQPDPPAWIQARYEGLGR
ncbi:MAG: polysaccharide deacetylase family protein [Holophagaceae bacterium]